MPHFDPSVHTTRDVVRQAVIPATRSSGEAYATQVAQGRARVPKAFLKFAVSLEVPYLNPFLVPSSTVGGFWVETRDLMQLLEGATLFWLVLKGSQKQEAEPQFWGSLFWYRRNNEDEEARET